jgi:polyferredoxin
MRADTSTDKKGVLVRYRTWIIIGGIILFLPPLSFLFQFTQDANFCGSWCPRMFFAWRKGMEIGRFFMGFLRSYMGVILVAGVLLSTLFFGRYWCSHLCPVGGTMETGSRFFPKFMKINFTKIPAPSFRYGYLLVYLVAPAIGLGSLCCNYCNFATIPRMYGAAVGGADMAYFLRTAGIINLLLIVVLGFIARGGRAYCNLLCPIGALDSLTNRFGARWGRRVLVAADKCNGCGACKKVCPTWAIEMKGKAATIDQFSCMPCRLCERSCKTEAIVYGKSSS